MLSGTALHLASEWGKDQEGDKYSHFFLSQKLNKLGQNAAL